MNGGKTKSGEILDLSDYARGLAVLAVKPFAHSSLRAWHITVFHFGLTLLMCYLISLNTSVSLAGAALLLQIKNILDAADGSLARLQNRPSRVGRFLDSNLDFAGHALMFLSIPDTGLFLKAAGFVFFVLQGSFYNYYFVLFRWTDGGDKTSKVDETCESPYPYDNPKVLKILFFFYSIFYLWQDKAADFVEREILKCGRKKPAKVFLRFVSVFAPGFQYLFVIMFLVGGFPSYIPLFFLLPYNGLLIGALYFRKKQCASEDCQ